MSADHMALLTFAAECQSYEAAPECQSWPGSNQLTSPGRRAHSGKPAASACSSQRTGQTDGQANRQTLAVCPAGPYQDLPFMGI